MFEVDNEIRAVPKVPLAGAAIEQKIREIVKADERFHGAGVMVAVGNGVASIQGSFSGLGDPVFLKLKVAEVEPRLEQA